MSSLSRDFAGCFARYAVVSLVGGVSGLAVNYAVLPSEVPQKPVKTEQVELYENARDTANELEEINFPEGLPGRDDFLQSREAVYNELDRLRESEEVVGYNGTMADYMGDAERYGSRDTIGVLVSTGLSIGGILGGAVWGLVYFVKRSEEASKNENPEIRS